MEWSRVGHCVGLDWEGQGHSDVPAVSPIVSQSVFLLEIGLKNIRVHVARQIAGVSMLGAIIRRNELEGTILVF